MGQGRKHTEDDLISTTEAAQIQGVVGSRIRQLILSGELPAQRVGRTWVLKRSDVESFKRKPRGGWRPRKGE
mgnify:CR=1 FL=1